MNRPVRLALSVSFVLVAVATFSARAQAADFTVTAQSTQNYTVNGELDPPLTLTRGRTYTFDVNTPNHPFYIKTQAGSGTANQFTDGVSGNGVTAGVLTFQVPLNAPAQLFYQCSVHAPMSGTLTIVNPAPAPAGGTTNGALLSCLLLALSLLHMRRAQAQSAEAHGAAARKSARG